MGVGALGSPFTSSVKGVSMDEFVRLEEGHRVRAAGDHDAIAAPLTTSGPIVVECSDYRWR